MKNYHPLNKCLTPTKIKPGYFFQNLYLKLFCKSHIDNYSITQFSISTCILSSSGKRDNLTP